MPDPVPVGTVGPWRMYGGWWGRWVDDQHQSNWHLVAHLGELPSGMVRAYYCTPGGVWQTRGGDDLLAAVRICNAGLRLLGMDCDDDESPAKKEEPDHA